MPWVSLAWGLVSGTLVGRRFEDATRVLAFAVGLLVASVCLGLWGKWLESRAPASGVSGVSGVSDVPEISDESVTIGEKAASLAPVRAGSLGGLLRRNEGRIQWLVTTGKQVFSQYILMFSIPFLWKTQAWPYLGLCVALVASTLWDPLFFRVVRFPAYRLLLRSTAFALATSFVVGVSFPSLVARNDVLSLGAALLGAMPAAASAAVARGSRKERKERRERRERVGAISTLFPLSLIALAALAHARLGGAWRFPVLSLWLASPSFELQDRDDAWVPREDRGARLDAGDVARGLAEGGRLCCVTPLVASRRLQSHVVHEWWVGGRLVEAIELSSVRGRDEGSAYRTYSCKRNVPGEDLASITCRVRVGTKNGPSVFVGEVPFGGR